MTRIKDRKDDDLLFEKKGRGFPHLVWMNANGDVLAVQGGRTVPDFQKTFDRLGAYMELKKKAEAGDAAAQIEVAILECELGMIDFGEMDEKLQGKELTAEQKAKVAALEVDATVDDMLQVLQKGRGSPDALKAAGSEFAKLHKAGRKPSDQQKTLVFFNVLLNYALAEKDTKLAEDSLAGLAKAIPDNPRAKQYVERMRTRIEQMKAEAASGDKNEEESDEGGMEEGCG